LSSVRSKPSGNVSNEVNISAEIGEADVAILADFDDNEIRPNIAGGDVEIGS
jgi:hypothetical protein